MDPMPTLSHWLWPGIHSTSPHRERNGFQYSSSANNFEQLTAHWLGIRKLAVLHRSFPISYAIVSCLLFQVPLFFFLLYVEKSILGVANCYKLQKWRILQSNCDFFNRISHNLCNIFKDFKIMNNTLLLVGSDQFSRHHLYIVKNSVNS